MQKTPRGMRTHIGLFGRCNVGKSSLINALSGQTISIVADAPGVTGDPVEKAFELLPAGPVVFIDTAGMDDTGPVAALRLQKTDDVIKRVDLGLLVMDRPTLGEEEWQILEKLKQNDIPCLLVLNKADIIPYDQAFSDILDKHQLPWVCVSTQTDTGISELKNRLIPLIQAMHEKEIRLFDDLIVPGDTIILVVPIDTGAPKGRLILPQVMALRDILDHDASAVMVKENRLQQTLGNLKSPPALVVCDSQVIKKVADETPEHIPLTTFSILMSRLKGDIIRFARGVAALHRIRPHDHVLIAEACSHHPQADDIGRIKIPRWLNHFSGGEIKTSVIPGTTLPDELSAYSLAIQCGGCMITRRQMCLRQQQAETHHLPMTNYGMAISVMQGVLERVLSPFPDALAAYHAEMKKTGNEQ